MSTKASRKFFFQENRETTLHEFQARNDDVWILSYPKNGTHWVNEIVTMLLKGEVVPSKDKELFMVEFNSNNMLDKLPSPRVLNTHFALRKLPEQIANKKIIFITRNPKDTAVSFYHHSNILRRNAAWRERKPGSLMSENWNEFLEQFLYSSGGKFQIMPESYFTYMLEWSQVLGEAEPSANILHLTYEGIKTDHLGVVKRISHFLDKYYDEEFYQAVTQQTSFLTMKQTHRCEDSPLGTEMFRKGIVGDWKNWFTVAQNENFEEMYKKKMENCYLYKYISNWN